MGARFFRWLARRSCEHTRLHASFAELGIRAGGGGKVYDVMLRCADCSWTWSAPGVVFKERMSAEGQLPPGMILPGPGGRLS
jgi:hypothetical protein